MRVRRLRAAAAIAAVGALTLAACGNGDGNGNGDPGDDPGANGGDDPATTLPLVIGTTDTVTNIDPAGSYDKPSWNIIYNTYQRLLSVPLGETEPTPDAAEQCDWDDDVTYT